MLSSAAVAMAMGLLVLSVAAGPFGAHAGIDRLVVQRVDAPGTGFAERGPSQFPINIGADHE